MGGMRKTPLLLLVFWLGFGNLAYAFSELTCAGMMKSAAQGVSFSKVAAPHDCCESIPCQCEIQARPTEPFTVSQSASTVEWDRAQFSLPGTFVGDVLSHHKPLNVFSSKSPPGHLYQLNSALRI